jgi:hypothetical protein
MIRTGGLAVSGIILCGLIAAAIAEERVALLPPYPLGSVIVLADGGIVAGRLQAVTPEIVTVDSLLLGRLDLPRSAVAGYRASMALGPVPPRRPDPAAGEAAVVRLVNGDEVLAEDLSAAAGEVTIRMGRPVPQEVTLGLESVRAIDFAAPPVAGTLPRTFVALSDGSRFVEASLPKVRDPENVVARLVDGESLRLLQGLEPLQYEQSKACPLARGSTVAGAWPAARGTTAFTGLGMAAPARVRYRFATPARRFESLVAIDDAAGQGGGAIVKVRAIDRGGAGRDVSTSPILWGGDEPHMISVDLGGAVELELIVDSADSPTPLDRTIWLDPRVRCDPARPGVD